ncbi:MAG: butyrate kinase [Coriobacteriales bacterium]|jgi:butyrate kinase|nr:butyrate kinase [Coriobacteriales bacterium]
MSESSSQPVILVINFGSTSTKIGVFEGEDAVFTKSYDHGTEEYPKKFADLEEHRAFAEKLIEGLLAEKGYRLEDVDVFVGRGGAQVFIESGAYLINEIMYDDTFKIGGDRHPGKLGTQISWGYSQKYGKPAYIVNGPSVDEFEDAARLTGLKEVMRQSRIHTLNQKEVAYRYAREHDLKYRELNLIVCHMGGGISITAHKRGRMVDSNDIIEGEGPMSPTRAGALPAMPLLELAYSGDYKHEDLVIRLVAKGGLIDHLGTADMREAEKMVAEGDGYAKIVLESMFYQIAKQAGAMAVVLDGQVDAILFTGGMARSDLLVDYLTAKLAWIAPIFTYPGEFELQGLASGIMRVLRGEEDAHEYTGKDVWTGFTH